MTPKDILVASWQAVVEADLPDDLRLVAFEKAVDIQLQQQAPTPVAHLSGGQNGRKRHSSEEASEGLLDRIAQRLKLDKEVIERVYAEHDGIVHITVPSKQLDSTDKGATEQLALLLVAARQGAGIEEVTLFREIRSTMKEFGRLNEGNFSGYVQKMKDKFLVTGSGQNRTAKMIRPGWDAATELVQKFAGVEGSES